MMRAAVGAVALVVVLVVSDARAEWTAMAPMPGGARWAHSAAEAGGKMYVMGGSDLYTVAEEYDPTLNSWQSMDDVPFSCRDARAVGSGGLVYLTGGSDDGTGMSVASLYVLDPAAAAGSQWTALVPMNQARQMHAAAVLGGKIYVFGGAYDDGATETGLSSVEAYDIAAGTWDASVADLPQVLAAHTATAVGTKIYLIGGVTGVPGAFAIVDTVYEFDPAGGGTYTPKASMPTARGFHAAAGAGGLIYVTGGVTILPPTPDAVAVCEVYDTAVDSWFTGAALPRELRLHGSCSIGTTVYVVGGEGPVSGASDANYAWTTPWVVSVVRADASPTNASAVDFTVTFNEDVTGVDAADFVVTGSGVTGDVTAVTPVSASVYTVTVGNITGEGDLGLDVVDDDTIIDLAGSPLGGTGPANGDHTGDETYTIDTTAPDAPVVIGATPTTDATPTWSWTQGASAGNGTFRYQLDGEDPGSWTETAAVEFTPGTALADGPCTLYVQERDDAGNWSASGSFEVMIDTTAPDAPVVTGTTPTADTTPTWTWAQGASPGNGTFRYQVNAETPGGWTVTTAQEHTPALGLADDVYTLHVQERDDAGNWSASGSFGITIGVPPPSADGGDSGCLPGSGAPGGLAVAILALAAALWARRAGAGPG